MTNKDKIPLFHLAPSEQVSFAFRAPATGYPVTIKPHSLPFVQASVRVCVCVCMRLFVCVSVAVC